MLHVILSHRPHVSKEDCELLFRWRSFSLTRRYVRRNMGVTEVVILFSYVVIICIHSWRLSYERLYQVGFFQRIPTIKKPIRTNLDQTKSKQDLNSNLPNQLGPIGCPRLKFLLLCTRVRPYPTTQGSGLGFQHCDISIIVSSVAHIGNRPPLTQFVRLIFLGSNISPMMALPFLEQHIKQPYIPFGEASFI